VIGTYDGMAQQVRASAHKQPERMGPIALPPMSEPHQASVIDRIRADFTTEAWVLIPIGAGLNIVVGSIVQTLRLPLFLDTIGTILVAMLAGPWVAVVTGVLTNVLLGFTVGPQLIPFALTNAAIALVVGYLATRGWFRIDRPLEYWRLLVTGIIVAVIATVVSAPLVVYLFGGITPSATGAITGFFLATGYQIWTSVLAASFIIEPIDKIASVVIAYLIAHSVPSRYLPKQGYQTLEAE
jgi:energy-coupling factor transport system substrate-specific component